MNIQVYREYCLSKPGVTEDFPFDEKTLVFKVCGKMFALLDVDFFESVNLKCDPEKAQELRASYTSIKPAYHMNKKHWNTVENDGSIEDGFLLQMTDDSYDLVIQKLTKKERAMLDS
jgi:predicted DNA-binding protein (MmcQ/YjbR family)